MPPKHVKSVVMNPNNNRPMPQGQQQYQPQQPQQQAPYQPQQPQYQQQYQQQYQPQQQYGGNYAAQPNNSDANLNFYSAGNQNYDSAPANPAYGGASRNSMGVGVQPDASWGNDYMSMTTASGGWKAAMSGQGLDDEPPLMEELGVNFDHIWKKTLAVLHPKSRRLEGDILVDGDMAGPLLFCLILGFVLLCGGKIQFGSIYGVGGTGCMGIWAILNLMSPKGMDILRTFSILGYCLIPIILLATINVFINLRGVVGMVLIPIAVLWATGASSLFFVVVLQLTEQRWLIAYPVLLFYTGFALISVF